MKKSSKPRGSIDLDNFLSPEIVEILNAIDCDEDDNLTPFTMQSNDVNRLVDESDADYEPDTDDDIFELSDLDDEVDDNMSRQTPLSVSSLPRADKHARKISILCQHILSNHYVKVCNSFLCVYSKNDGHYERMDRSESLVFIEACFDTTDRVSLSNKVIDEVLSKLLRTPGLQILPDEFNTDVTEINCLNGIVKIGGSSIELLPHTPDKIFSYSIQANLILNPEEINCVAFDQFCETSLDGKAEKRTLLLQAFGYTCSDSNIGKTGLFLKGQPNSGKSVALEFLTTLIGKQNVSNIAIHCLGSRFNKAELFGKKANIQAEMKSDRLPDISTYKAITGSDRIMGEYKGKTPFYFMPRAKLVFAGNALPGTRELEATSAMRNRIVPLLFNKTIKPEDQDPLLKQKLIGEIDSLFTLSMLELDKLHKQNYKFDLPAESLEFLEAYSAVENSVRTFLKECCVMDASETIFNTDLIKAYLQYCHNNEWDPFNKTELYTILDNTAGLRRCRIHKDGQNKWGYRGIRLMEQMEQSLLK